MKCSPARVLLWLSFLLALATFCLTGFANNKSWFDVPTNSQSPSFSMWHVCYDGLFRDCDNVMAEDDKFQYGAFIYVTRTLIISSMLFSLALTVMAAMTLMGSYKLIGHTYLFPVVSGINGIALLAGCVIFEAGVRLQVMRKMTKINETELESQTHFSGFCAWFALACGGINCFINGAFYLRTRYETYV